VRALTGRPSIGRGPARTLAVALSFGALAACWVLSPAAADAVTGGSSITIEQAPWQAEIEMSDVGAGKETRYCGASILENNEVLTAAHCLYDSYNNGYVPAAHINVLAGTSELEPPEAEAQTAAVSQVRIDPYFSPQSELPWNDDLALLTLETPLVPGAKVKTISPAPAEGQPGEGAGVNFNGFGEEGEDTPIGALHSIGLSLLYPRVCANGQNGAANALFLCASSTSGAACRGDIGSGLTTQGSSPELVGVLSDIAGGCKAGTLGAYGNVTAPELRDFIEQIPGEPPLAPQGGGALIRAVIKVGHPLTCEPGSWSNSPTFTYTFADSTSGAVLQKGSSSVYTLQSSDVGRKILCEIHATNAGGTGIGRTPGLGPIEAVPSPPSAPVPQPAPVAIVEPGKLSLAVKSVVSLTRSEGLRLKLICTGRTPCEGRLTVTTTRIVEIKGSKRRRTLTIGTATVKLAPGTTTLTIRLNGAGRAALGAAHGRLGARLMLLGLQGTQPGKGQVELLHLRRARGRA
jgi:Trypsin